MTNHTADQDLEKMFADALGEFEPPEGLEKSLRGRIVAEIRSGSVEVVQAQEPPWILRSGRLARYVAAAAAVCLLAFVGWWLMSNGYELIPSAYAELAEAIENTKAAEWVHSKMTIDGKQVEGWVSFKPDRSITREGERVEFVDYQAGRHWKYDPEARTITILTMVEEENPLAGAESYLDLMLAGFEGAEEEEGVSLVKGEEVIDGKKYVTYSVTVDREEVSGTGRILVDPELNRVVRMERFVESEGMTEPQVIEFEYPKTGPADIYALGVPRDAKIVHDRIVRNMPGWTKIKNKVTLAQKAFPQTYTGIVAKADVQKSGKLRLSIVWVVYKKDGAYRIEQVKLTGMEEPLDDLAGFIEWASTRPVYSVKFCPADEKTKGTRIEMRKPGQLSRTWAHNMRPLQGSVEEELWGYCYALADGDRSEHTMLLELQRENGPLVGIERKLQGLVDRGGNVFTPQKTTLYLNPQRDWIFERTEVVSDPHAPWQKDKNWLEGVDPADDARVSKHTYVVQEYDRTADGHWYAKSILGTLESTSIDANGVTKPKPNITHRAIMIFLDTERVIPDEWMDPGSVTAERFDEEAAKRHEAFDKAIAEIDSRETWPLTAEDVVNAYIEACAAGNMQELAVLYPGSAVRRKKADRVKGRRFVLGKARKSIGVDQVIIQCAPRDRFEKDGRYTHSISLRNSFSKKKRYYVEWGPY